MPRNSSTNTMAFIGMDRTTGIERLPPGVMSYAQNCRFTPQGACYVRPGYMSRYEHATDGGFAILGLDLPDYQALFIHMDTDILVTQDGVNYYDTGNTRTATYSTFFDLGQDIFHVNKTDNWLRISTSRTISVILDTDTEIAFDIGDTANFLPGGGTVYIQGHAIAYTSVNVITAELEGVTGIPTGGFTDTNIIITQNHSLSDPPKCTALAELEGSTLAGDRSNHPEIISYSAPATEADPQYAYDFSGTGAGSKKLRKSITALFSSKDVCLIGQRRGISYSAGFGGAAGDALVTGVLHESDGVPNQKSIVDMDGITVVNAVNRFIGIVMNQSGGVKILDDEFNTKNNMDYPISSDLKRAEFDENLTFAYYSDKQRELVCGVVIDGNIYHYVRSADSRAWTIDTGKPFTNMASFKGRTFAISQYTNKIYEDYVGLNDDGLPIHTIIKTGEHTQNSNLTTSDFTNLIFAGRISNVGDFKLKIYVDGDLYHTEFISAENLREKGLILDSVAPGGTGTSSIGGDPLTNDLQITNSSRFVFPYEMLLTGESVQIEWEVLSQDTYLELRKYSINSETEGELELSNF